MQQLQKKMGVSPDVGASAPSAIEMSRLRYEADKGSGNGRYESTDCDGDGNSNGNGNGDGGSSSSSSSSSTGGEREDRGGEFFTWNRFCSRQDVQRASAVCAGRHYLQDIE